MKNIVILSGAGISAESGIKTFRDSDGLWENHDVMSVASIDGWYKNPELVQQFYNERRKQLEQAQPNKAHHIVAELEKRFQVTVITQNVDNLHERAGSSNVLHLHGELTKACNETKDIVSEIGYRAILSGEKAEDGSRLRPFIVWFGEAVPLIETAAEIVATADLLVIVGTSLQVYPAAGLVRYARPGTPIYVIDPAESAYSGENVFHLREKASVGMERLQKDFL